MSSLEDRLKDKPEAILSDLLEIIGEDDYYSEMCESCNDWDVGRNDLREELRLAITKYCKGE